MSDEDCVWEVHRSPYPSKFLSGSIQFGETAPLYLVDQFDGKRPALINHEFILRGELNFSMYPSALLDSNILNAIESRVLKNKRLDGLEGFLRFVTEKNWDFNPLFYYMEHFTKSEKGQFLPNAIRRTEALLKLHSMDQKHFLQNGEIIPDPRAIEHYTKTCGVKSLQEVAEYQVHSFAESYDRQGLAAMIEASQVALIKMVLLHKAELPGEPTVRKYEEFIRFLREELGIILGREAHLALHYFCDRAGKLLGIQSNTAIDKAIATVRSTAWDIFLLRFPEILFTDSSDEVCIAYVATQEKHLHELARLFTIERIHNRRLGPLSPYVSYDSSNLPQAMVEEIASDMLITPLKTSATKSTPKGLLSEMEKELAKFCCSA